MGKINCKNLINKLFSLIKQELSEASLSANRLGLELTESTIMQDSAQGLETLAHLSELGLYLFIDDFGTGYSSLSRLRDCDCIQGHFFIHAMAAEKLD